MSDVLSPDGTGQCAQQTVATTIVPVGILGGGQLAMMLTEAAHHLQLSVHIFSNNHNDVAASMADSHVVAAFTQAELLHHFFSSVGTVIYENEWINPQKLIEAAQGTAVKILPKPSAMAACGDKLLQKDLLTILGIPTSRFVSYPLGGSYGPEQWLQSLGQEFPKGCVLKWAKGGYDGKGTMMYMPQPGGQDIPVRVLDFVRQAVGQKVSIYAEQLVKFQQELALLTVRSEDGSCHFYPMVQTRQEDGVCVDVQGPAQKFGLDAALEQEARAYAIQIGDQLDLRGVYAIEFFQDTNGQLLVNEIAPRVHNSGHFTLDGAVTSQFENHWRAVLGLPIGDISCAEFFGMVNILGPVDFEGSLEAPQLSSTQTVVHWYRKEDSRPGRKMGHVNVFATDREMFGQLMAEVHQQLMQWSQLWSSGPQR